MIDSPPPLAPLMPFAPLTSADPLSAAPSRWLAVEMAGYGFLIPLVQAGEIFQWLQPQPVPYTKAWFLGVVNLRGVLCGVIDFSKFIKLAPSPMQADKSSTLDKRLIGFHTALETNAVLLVDRLLGLRTTESMRPTCEANAYLDDTERAWLEIDLFELAQDARFANITISN
jgi:twitching motility protein PilI